MSLRGAALAALVCLIVAAPATAAPPVVTDVALVSPHTLPEARVRAAIGDLAGRPRDAGTIRESVAHVWSLGLFSDVRVEEEMVAGGVRLTFRLARRPLVRTVTFVGDLRLPAADLAATARVPIGGSAAPDDLARARRELIALLAREGFFRATVVADAATDAVTNERDVTFTVDAGERARVGRVAIRGLQRAPARSVERALDVDDGDRFRERAIRDGAQAAETTLREAGFFEARARARWDWDPASNRVAVTLDVVEGPEVRVDLTGATAIRAPALLERLTFAQTGVVDDVELHASVAQLESAYREQGYHFVAAGGALRREGDLVVVRIDVVEGPRVVVESIELAGRLPLPAGVLRRELATRPAGLIRRGAFVQETLERDERALAIFLANRGFPEARVGPSHVTFSEDRSRAHVVIPVVAGPKVTVGALSVAGAGAIDADTLKAALPLRPGAPWSAAAAEDGRRLLERRYARKGYHGADVQVETLRRDDAVDVTYRVAEGEPTRIGRILVSGLTLTQERVVLRSLGVEPGMPLDPEALVEAQRRLALLGVFDDVTVEPLRPPAAPFAPVTVSVREGKPWHVAGGVGYSTYERARAFVEVGHDNLFGTARGLALRLRVSERGERADVLYREPWVLGTSWIGDGALFYEHRDEIGYEFEQRGLTLGIHRDLMLDALPGLHAAIRYGVSQVDRFNVDRTLADADVTPGTEVIASVTPELTLERRDRPLDPHRGSFHLASVEVGGLVLGGDADFVKSRLETAWFFDWLSPTVVALSARLGLATPLRDTESLPIERRFFAGGSTTVRGYREQRLGPLDARGNPRGGNAQLILNAEWRFPIWRWLGGAVFFDTGAVTESVRDLAPDELRSGAGAGLRLVTPVGPVRLDAAYPLDPVPAQDQVVRYYITVGYPF